MSPVSRSFTDAPAPWLSSHRPWSSESRALYELQLATRRSIADRCRRRADTDQEALRLRGPLWVAAYGIHANPRFYKHYWKIWTWIDVIPDEELPELRRRFGPYPWLVIVPELSFSDAIKRMKELCERGERFMVSDERVKRDDPSAPWDIQLIRSKGGRVAPAYDDDPDEPFFRHK